MPDTSNEKESKDPAKNAEPDWFENVLSAIFDSNEQPETGKELDQNKSFEEFDSAEFVGELLSDLVMTPLAWIDDIIFGESEEVGEASENNSGKAGEPAVEKVELSTAIPDTSTSTSPKDIENNRPRANAENKAAPREASKAALFDPSRIGKYQVEKEARLLLQNQETRKLAADAMLNPKLENPSSPTMPAERGKALMELELKAKEINSELGREQLTKMGAIPRT